METIFALSSGAPPAAISVIRLSGGGAGAALAALSRRTLPPPRRAALRRLLDASGDLLDEALVLWCPGPGTSTGEDVVELHCHGGRAVVAAVEAALSALPGLRAAEPGEFTRRAFANGRIDLAEAEGLGDLLTAETELQRRAALDLADGRFSRQVDAWRTRVLDLAAQIESALDFADEADVTVLPPDFLKRCEALADELRTWLARPRAERLRDGVRVVLAGPPNAGKSTLFNALLEQEAAITSPLAGTTRDAIERPISIAGMPFILVDTAGLRTDAGDMVEREGISRARAQLEGGDLILWLGPSEDRPLSGRVLDIDPRIDEAGHHGKARPDLRVSAVSGTGLDDLRTMLVERARTLLPQPGQGALNARQAELVGFVEAAVRKATAAQDDLVVAEHLRHARIALDRLLGTAATEDMLDALFSRFCIGK